jgi:hypothetical protein
VVRSAVLDRRAFLARIGVLGLAAATPGLMPRLALAAGAGPGDQGLGVLVGLLRPLLDELARDTLNGMVVFVVPGPDAYSTAQGTPRTEPGAMEARTTDFMIQALDNFVPFPDQLARPIATAFATGLATSVIPLPPALVSLPLAEVGTVDKALSFLLQNNQTIPLSLVIALTLNFVATQVDVAALNGPFVSPFSRLSFAQKAQAFALLESGDSDLVRLLDQQLPQPLTQSVSGVLKFVAGALLEFAAFGSFSEFGVFDPASRTLTGRPVGWQLTSYLPHGAPVDGWDDLQGYYQGRREVTG